MSASSQSRIVFGLVVPSAGSGLGERVDQLVSWMSEHAGVRIERRDAASYEALATDVREGHTDIAWLPPIVYLRLGELVTPIGSVLRGGASTYEAALIVRESSKTSSQSTPSAAREPDGWIRGAPPASSFRG